MAYIYTFNGCPTCIKEIESNTMPRAGGDPDIVTAEQFLQSCFAFCSVPIQRRLYRWLNSKTTRPLEIKFRNKNKPVDIRIEKF